MLQLLNRGISPYKAEQLKIFFRFLKEYKYYSKYVKILNDFIDNEFNSNHLIYDYHSGKYVKIVSYDMLYNSYLYNLAPTCFLDIMRIPLLRDLWYYNIIDYHILHYDNSPFDSTDISKCCKILCIDYKKYCKNFYKKWQKKENQNFLQKK